jgi:hypothetical protein
MLCNVNVMYYFVLLLLLLITAQSRCMSKKVLFYIYNYICNVVQHTRATQGLFGSNIQNSMSISISIMTMSMLTKMYLYNYILRRRFGVYVRELFCGDVSAFN